MIKMALIRDSCGSARCHRGPRHAIMTAVGSPIEPITCPSRKVPSARDLRGGSRRRASEALLPRLASAGCRCGLAAAFATRARAARRAARLPGATLGR